MQQSSRGVQQNDRQVPQLVRQRHHVRLGGLPGAAHVQLQHLVPPFRSEYATFSHVWNAGSAAWHPCSRRQKEILRHRSTPRTNAKIAMGSPCGSGKQRKRDRQSRRVLQQKRRASQLSTRAVGADVRAQLPVQKCKAGTKIHRPTQNHSSQRPKDCGNKNRQG